MPCVVVAPAAIAITAGATNVAPFAGEEIATLGAAGAVTVTGKEADVAEAPLLPMALAFNE